MNSGCNPARRSVQRSGLLGRALLVSLGLLLVFPTLHAGAKPENEEGIDRLSLTSLLIRVLHDHVPIATASGFVVSKNGQYYLVTNRHVVKSCARDEDRRDIGGWICANALEVFQNEQERLGERRWVREELYEHGGNDKRWLEHPSLGAAVDVVALPLSNTAGVAFYPLDLGLRNTSMVIGPAEPVSVVGFPFGQSQGGAAIWKSGWVASDPDIDYDGKPLFLVDATTRPGMSGSPVYARRSGGYQDAGGHLVMTVGRGATKFLGVYSAQFETAELGVVWKADVVISLYNSLR